MPRQGVRRTAATLWVVWSRDQLPGMGGERAETRPRSVPAMRKPGIAKIVWIVLAVAVLAVTVYFGERDADIVMIWAMLLLGFPGSLLVLFGYAETAFLWQHLHRGSIGGGSGPLHPFCRCSLERFVLGRLRPVVPSPSFPRPKVAIGQRATLTWHRSPAGGTGRGWSRAPLAGRLGGTGERSGRTPAGIPSSIGTCA